MCYPGDLGLDLDLGLGAISIARACRRIVACCHDARGDVRGVGRGVGRVDGIFRGLDCWVQPPRWEGMGWYGLLCGHGGRCWGGVFSMGTDVLGWMGF